MNVEKYVTRTLSQDNFFLGAPEGSVKQLGWGNLNHDSWEFELDEEIYNDVSMYSEEGIALFKAFCAEHNVHFYAADRENFSMLEAFTEAVNAGADYLLAEDLS